MSSHIPAVHEGLNSLRQGGFGTGTEINLLTWVVQGIGEKSCKTQFLQSKATRSHLMAALGIQTDDPG